MATAIREMKDSDVPYAWPTIESVEDALRRTRRAVTEARNATEDFAAGASLEVRRHPLTAVGLATGAGIAAGTLLGFAAGWYFRSRR